MILVHNGELAFYRFEIFREFPEVVHGVFTRKGGVSPDPWNSLNMATSVGDSRENVLQNRDRILKALGLPGWGFYDVWQVHGTDVVPALSPRPLDQAHLKADSILTDREGVALLMLFADCVPILLYDPIRRAVGMAHAGWQGTVDKVVSKAVEQMGATYGSRPVNIHAGIGPSICRNHYEVGLDVIIRVRQSFKDSSALLYEQFNGKAHLDLREANRQTLMDNGILESHIQICEICTAEDLATWYSHRGENGKTGRFGAVLAVRNSN